MSEKICLKWNDFQDNVNSAFGSLHKENEFADVTLACDDGQQIEAHKVILAASSPFFQKLLRKNKHPHPLIFIMGMKSEDLVAIVDFLYCGETRIHQENIDSFLAIAEQFELKGFLFKNLGQDIKNHGTTIKVESEPITRKANNLETVSEPEPTRLFSKEQKSTSEIATDHILPPTQFFFGDLQELDEKVKSMMEESQNMISNGKQRARTCKVCGKEGHGMNIRDHIEANHLEGFSLPCNDCERSFR